MIIDNPIADKTIIIPIISKVCKVSPNEIKAKSNPNTGIRNRYNDNLPASYLWRSQNQIIVLRAVPTKPKNINKLIKIPVNEMLLTGS